MERIDGHQHFWRYDPASYGWIGPAMHRIARDWLPGDLRPLLDAAGIDRCIAVQARGVEAETDFLLGLAAEHPWIAGVIGWAELRAGDVTARLARWDGQRALKGLRHQLQDEADLPGILGSTAFRDNVRTLQSRGLVYEVLIQAHQFAGVTEFCRALDGHYLVLDHLGKPAIRDGAAGFAAWRAGLKDLAALPHVLCKLSGLVTEARWQDGRLEQAHDDFLPYLDAALDCFGPDRLIFGSDWPVSVLAGGYAEVIRLIETWARRLSPGEQAALWGGTAQRCYALD